MDILEPRVKQSIDENLRRLFHILSFQMNEPVLVGSASLQSSRYVSDYDLVVFIRSVPSATEAYTEFQSILQELYLKTRVYPVEFKLQTKQGTKIRWFPGQAIDLPTFEKYWPSVDFCKVDVVAETAGNRFVEVSCVYLFGTKKRTKQDYIVSLEDDRKQLEQEGSYWKALKRVFSINRLQGRKKDVVLLSRIFNSNLGALYQILSYLQALNRLKIAYPGDKLLRKKIEVGLKDLQVKGGIRSIPSHIREIYDTLNKEIEPVYRQFTGERVHL